MHNIKSWLSGSTNVYCTLVPFYYCLKIFGLAPYHLESINGNIRVTCYHYISVLCFLSFYLLTLIGSLYRIGTTESVFHAGQLLQFVHQTMMIFFIVSVNFVRRDSIFSFLKLIAKFDTETMNMKFKVNHSKKRWVVSAFIGCSFIVLICIYFFTIHVFGEVIAFHVMISLYFTQSYIMSVWQFIFGGYSIVSRFNILNQNAR